VSKNVAMFVDVANMYYAARGQDVDVDYVALLKHATKGRDLIRAYAYTGLDPENENQRKFIDFLGKNGYKPVVKDIRKFGDGRMKANLDIELVVDLFRLADRMDIAVIVSGDGDFAPAIRALQDTGVRCEVVSFKPNTSSDLIQVADEFTDIMKIASISRKEGRAARSMSAPEMPAKEVNPEFGFREASPSVAAAALAALRSGSGEGSRGSSNGRRRSTSSRSEAAEAPRAEAAVADEESEASEETRRRRRRRGGRGRGRGRREGQADELGTEETAAPSEGEVGWEEFDDLSQLEGVAGDEGDEGDVPGFEEADAATLAELGLTPEEVEELSRGAAATEAPAAEEEAPKRRRSTRAKKADEGSAAAPATEEEAPKRRRSTRAKKADEGSAEPAAPAEEAPKRRRSTRAKKADEGSAEAQATEEEAPKRRRSTRAKKADEKVDEGSGSEATGDGEGEPQGIWGRFRSARTTRGGSGS
jgi:uncharacterized LabA/DUF88 family protein